MKRYELDEYESSEINFITRNEETQHLSNRFCDKVFDSPEEIDRENDEDTSLGAYQHNGVLI